MSKQIKVSDEVHQRLMGAKSDTETVSDLIARLLDDGERLAATTVPIDDAVALILDGRPAAAPIDEADALLEELDNPKVDPILADLAPGELPECCQGIYDDPEHPVPTCEHWEKAWVNNYGNKVVHYRNKLTGGSYFDYFNKYVGA